MRTVDFTAEAQSVEVTLHLPDGSVTYEFKGTAARDVLFTVKHLVLVTGAAPMETKKR